MNGTNIRAGDLYASGTVSGPTRHSLGSLLEMSLNGAEPIALSGGTRRTFLLDGDTVTLRGWCGSASDGFRIGFGECRGTVLPSVE